ncbi:TPA: mannosyl-3-phosphoglycerate phosphatase-related protein [Citrobacter freundii]
MLSLNENILVFSDLDGTLLDSHTLAWQPAAAWLTRLKEHNIPLILCSSKTAASMLEWQKTFNLQGMPLIAENGAVVHLDARWQNHPDYPRKINGISHTEIDLIINRLRSQEQYKFTSFDDVDEQIIAEWTGVSRAQATLARLHEASVSLIWRDTDERMAQFAARLQEHGLQLVAGGHFWHVLDIAAGKDIAANSLIAEYQRQWGTRPVPLGLGDGPGDAPLLEAMDYAVVVKGLNREGVVLRKQDPRRVYRTEQEGPAGWHEGLEHLFAAR